MEKGLLDRLKRAFLDMRLRSKLMLVYSVLAILPAVAVGLASHAISGDALQDEVVAFLDSDLSKSAAGIDAELSYWTEKSRILAVSEVVMVQLPSQTDEDYPEVFSFYKKLDALFAVALNLDESLSESLLYRMEIFTFNENVLKDGYYIRDAADFRSDAIPAGTLSPDSLAALPSAFWLPVTVDRGGRSSVTLCRKLFTSGYGKTTGLLCVHLPVESFRAEIDRMSLPLGAWALYFDGKDQPVFAIGTPGEGAEQAFRESVKTDAALVETEDALLFVRGTPSNGGHLVLSYPKSYLQRRILGILGVTWIIVLASAVAAVLVSVAFAGLITRRLTRFADRASDMERPGSPPPPLFEGNDEIGVLSRTFGRMLERIDRMRRQRYRAILRKRGLELELLQSQMNPHFLYNILSSIKLSGGGILGDVVDSIVRFFRMSLNKGAEAVDLATEIAIVKEYVHIQQFTYDEEFAVEYDVDPAVLDCSLIKLVLQPVVENAILHGITGKRDGSGRILIRAAREGEDLVLSVADNGKGMGEEDLLRLGQGKAPRKASSGYGLRSVRERIRLVYGERYGLSIESASGIGTRVILRVPCLSADALDRTLGRFAGEGDDAPEDAPDMDDWHRDGSAP